MRRSLAAAAILLLGALPGCSTTVVVGQPTLERELAASLEARRLDAVVDRLLRFREGVAREGADLGRVDRVDRAAAARAAAAVLRGDLGAVHRGRLDRAGRVDLDLALFLLDQAEDNLRLADLDEERIAALAAPAGHILAWRPLGAPPSKDLIGLLFDPGAGFLDADLAPAGRAPGAPPEGARIAEDLRAADRRLRQAADLLRRLGDAVSVLHPGDESKLARERARAKADRLVELGKKRDEEAKALPGGEGKGFAPPCGRERFVAALRTRHGVEETPEALEEFGRALLAETKAALEALAAASFPGRTWKSAMEEARRDHAAAADIPAEALRDAAEAREFCIERGIVTIPPAARLGHVELVGDDMARSYPFAAYSFREQTTEGESGRYMVSPGATWMDAAQREARLSGNCRAWTRVVAPHETWPGHHLQIWVADHLCSRLRREAWTSTFVEGWGLYCESLLDSHGYFAKPEQRLALLAMRAWRACRVVLDVRLHCGGMTPEQGVAFLEEHAGLTTDAATAEVTRYMGSPTQPFTYAWGRREILSLRADEERRLGERFSEREFHDRLLRCGPIPFRFVRRLFGYEPEDAPAEGSR